MVSHINSASFELMLPCRLGPLVVKNCNSLITFRLNIKSNDNLYWQNIRILHNLGFSLKPSS